MIKVKELCVAEKIPLFELIRLLEDIGLHYQFFHHDDEYYMMRRYEMKEIKDGT